MAAVIMLVSKPDISVDARQYVERMLEIVDGCVASVRSVADLC